MPGAIAESVRASASPTKLPPQMTMSKRFVSFPFTASVLSFAFHSGLTAFIPNATVIVPASNSPKERTCLPSMDC